MLMNTGSVASLRRNLGMLDDEEREVMQGGQGRPTVPPLDPRNLSKPFVPPPPPREAMTNANLLRLQDAVPENVTSLLSADQQRNAVPGLWTRIGNWLAEGKGTREQIQDRVTEQLDLEKAGRVVQGERSAEAEKARLDATRAEAVRLAGPMPNDWAGQQAWARKLALSGFAANDLKAFPLIGQMFPHLTPDQPQARTPMRPEVQRDVLGEDGEPYIVYRDPTTLKELHREKQFKRSEDLTEWQIAQLDLARQRLAKTGQSRTGAILKKARVQNDTGLATVKRVIADLEKPGKAGEEAVGWKAYLPDAVLNRWFPEGVQTRSGLQNVGSLILHDRFGAALTKTELQRAGFIPFDTDRADVARSKLAKLVQFIEMQNAALDDQTAEEGSDTPTGKTKKIVVNGKTFIVPDE